jgi:hypothetical protein
MNGIKNIRRRLRCMALLGSFSRIFGGNGFTLSPTFAVRLISPHAGGCSLITRERIHSNLATRPREGTSQHS